MIDDLSPTARERVRDDVLARLAQVLTLRSMQERNVWTGFGAFWLANAVLLVALVSGGVFPLATIAAVVAGAGVALSVVAALLLRRGAAQIQQCTAVASRLEQRLDTPPELALATAAADDWRVTTLPALCAGVAALLWLLALALSLYAGVFGLMPGTGDDSGF